MNSRARADRLYQLVGERVRAVRLSKNMTQGALASLANVARTSVTNLEKGRQKFPLHQLAEIADVLGVNLADLLPTRNEMQDKHVEVIVGQKTAQVAPVAAHTILQFLRESPDAKAPKS